MNDQVKAVFDENILGVLATVNEDGSPWATPLHIIADEKAVYWFSSSTAVHSQNIAKDERVSVAVFSPDKSEGLKGVYVSGSAAVLAQDERPAVFALLEKRFGAVPPHFVAAEVYRLPIGRLDEAKSSGNCWYFYS